LAQEKRPHQRAQRPGVCAKIRLGVLGFQRFILRMVQNNAKEPRDGRSRRRHDRCDGSHLWGGIMIALACLLLIELMVNIAQQDSQRPCSRRLGGGGEANVHDATAHGRSKAFEPVTFFLLAYLASAISQQIPLELPCCSTLPHSVLLFIIGVLMSVVADNVIPEWEIGRAIKDFQNLDPHVIFWVLLPPLLYEDASAVHWHVFKRCLGNALTLALPGVIMNTVLTGLFVKCFFLKIEWTWSGAFVLGSILSATDPVAVVGALHELHAPDKLQALIAGESLFNDGSGVVLFQLFMAIAKGEREFEPGYTAWFFCRMAMGGPLLAIVTSTFVYLWLRKAGRFNIEVIVVVVAIFFLFFVSEHEVVGVSGVLAVVVFGLFMAAAGHYALSIETEHRHHVIMNFLALLANEAIFVLAGVVSYRFETKGDFDLLDIVDLLLLYLAIHFSRAAVIMIFLPVMRKLGYGVTWKEAVICVYGGLRGAVGLAMALLLEHESEIRSDIRSRVAFHTSGIVLLTLLVNGTTVTPLYKKLQVYQKPPNNDHLLCHALAKADKMSKRHAARMIKHWFFQNCNAKLIDRLVPEIKCVDNVARIDNNKINVAIDSFATELDGSEIEAHIMNKLTASRASSRQQTGSTDQPDRYGVKNPFLPGRISDYDAAAEEEQKDEFDIALRAAKPNFGTIALCVAATSSSASPQSRLARQRWQRARLKVREIVKVMKDAKCQRQDLQDKTQSKYFNSARQRFGVDEYVLRKDKASVAEVHQTVINSARAFYRHMFEKRCLKAVPFRVIMEALDLREEAVAMSAEKESERAESINTYQAVGWEYLKTKFRTPCRSVFRLVVLICPIKDWLHARWIKMQIDMEMCLAYIITEEQLVTGEVEILSGFEEEVRNPLKVANDAAKREALFELVREPRDHAMFLIFEHILLARLIVGEKRHFLQHLVEEGFLGDKDCEKLIDDICIPSEKALMSYVPTKDQLRKAGSTMADSYKNNVIKRGLMQLVPLLDVHEEEWE